MEKVIGKTVLIRGAANPPGEVRRAKTALIDTLNDERGFGPLMEALTKAFQREAGLMDDGKIGGYTWEKLLG
jgi:peptidoglycan hydrolase-like protein with peptidoglycan-binding domain